MFHRLIRLINVRYGRGVADVDLSRWGQRSRERGGSGSFFCVSVVLVWMCRGSRSGRKVKARKTTRQTLQNKIFQHAQIRITALTPKTSSMYNQSCFTSALMGACRGLCFPPVVSSQTTNYLTKNRKTAEKSARCRLNHLLRQM